MKERRLCPSSCIKWAFLSVERAGVVAWLWRVAGWIVCGYDTFIGKFVFGRHLQEQDYHRLRLDRAKTKERCHQRWMDPMYDMMKDDEP